MGDDFSDVRVHTDAEANELNHDLQADAFTTGKDIFFRDGKYNPASSDGQKLLAHELTHVVQQRDAPSGGAEMTVSDPGDASERQASDVAEKVSSGSAASVGREEIPEEEELATLPALDREEVPEEEELQMSPALDREEVPEEEELQMSPTLDREEVPEEEELQMSPTLQRAVPLDDDLAGAPSSSIVAPPTAATGDSPAVSTPTQAPSNGFQAQPPGAETGGLQQGGTPAVPAAGETGAAVPAAPPAAPLSLAGTLLQGTAGKYLSEAREKVAAEEPSKADLQTAAENLQLAQDATLVVAQTAQVKSNESLKLIAAGAHNLLLASKKDVKAHLGETLDFDNIRQDLGHGQNYLDQLTKRLP